MQEIDEKRHGGLIGASLSRAPCARRWPEIMPSSYFRRMYAKTAAWQACSALAACIDFRYDAPNCAVPYLKVVQGHDGTRSAENLHLNHRVRGENHAEEECCSIRCA